MSFSLLEYFKYLWYTDTSKTKKMLPQYVKQKMALQYTLENNAIFIIEFLQLLHERAYYWIELTTQMSVWENGREHIKVSQRK